MLNDHSHSIKKKGDYNNLENIYILPHEEGWVIGVQRRDEHVSFTKMVFLDANVMLIVHYMF